MYKRPSSSPSVTTVTNSRDGGYRGETEHDSSRRRQRRQQHQIDSRVGRSSSTTYTTVTSITTTDQQQQQQHQKQQQGLQLRGGCGITSQANPSSHDYPEISSAPSSRAIQSGSIAPPSHTAAASLRRQFGYTPRVQDTNTASVTLGKQTTQRPIVQLTGDQSAARASSLNSQH